MGKLGDMKRKVEVTHPVTSKSAMGAPQKTFAHLRYLVVSRIAAGDIPEGYVNNRLVTPKRYKYRAHIAADIDETMRLTDNGIVFNILSVDVDPEDKLFIEILAEKVTE